jgi:hypothetical protein
MAQAIPKADWSQAEAHRERQFYWQYLVNEWLVPGPAVLSEANRAEDERWMPPTVETLHENGWFLEPATNCEQ